MLFVYRIIFYIFLALLFSYMGFAFTSTIFQLIADIHFMGISNINPEQYIELFGEQVLQWELFDNYILSAPNIFIVWIAIAVIGQLLVNSPFQFVFVMALASSAINLAIFYFVQYRNNIPFELTELFSFPYTVPIASGLIALFLTEKRKIPQRETYEREKISQKVKTKKPQPKPKAYNQETEAYFKNRKLADLSKEVNKESSKVIQQKIVPKDKKTLSVD